MINQIFLIWIFFGILGYITDMIDYHKRHKPLNLSEYIAYFFIAILLGPIGFIFILVFKLKVY